MSIAAKARLEEGTVKIVDCRESDFCITLRKMGYLDQEGELDPLEAAFQLSRGRIELEECGSGWRCALQILVRLEIDLDLFTVYRDLRRKGRKPRIGFRRKTLLYEHLGRIYEVLVLSEGYTETLKNIIEWSRQASADNHMPVIAVVDRTGLITYYEARASRSIQ